MFHQRGGHTLVVLGEAGLDELQFQLSKHRGRRRNFNRVLPDLCGHLHQNAMDLCQFLFQQADQFIVLLDGFKRFHKDRLPT